MFDFKTLARLTAGEEAFLTRKLPGLGSLNIGLGPDASEYETTVLLADSATVARQITKAAKLAKSGGPPLPELSATAKAILAAGVRRRAGG
jgi:hypothetical protein